MTRQERDATAPPTPDQLAGVADLFGALTRAELHQAFTDLAARTGSEFDPTDLDAHIDAACDDFYLLELDPDLLDTETPSDPLYIAGPGALPTIPEHGDDLPHIMAIEPRSIPTNARRLTAEQRLRAAAAKAVNAADHPRIQTLLDTCYDFEAWAAIDTSEIRDRLAAVLEEGRAN